MMFYTRDDWGASAPNRPSGEREITTYVFVHHLAVPAPKTLDEAKAQLRSIQADHKSRLIDPRKPELGYWADFAYNLSPSRFGLFEGRGWDVKSGGTGPGSKVGPPWPYTTWDALSLSLGVMGNFEHDELDADLEAVLIDTLREVRARYGNAVLVRGDRDVNHTVCCGAKLYPHLDRLWQASAVQPQPQPIPEIPNAMPVYILRHTNTNNAWLAIYEGGAVVRHIGGGEAGYLLNVVKVPMVVETDYAAYLRTLKASGTDFVPTP